MSESDPAWQFFAALQSEADPHSIDRSLARDEALDVILNEIVREPSADPDLLRKRFYSLCRNRLSKQTNRRALDRCRSRGTHRRGGTDFGSVLLAPTEPMAFTQLAYRLLTALIRTVLPEEELRLLAEIADGHSYADMARNHHMTLASLKSKVFRVRDKVRNSGSSAVLRDELLRFSNRNPQPLFSASRIVVGSPQEPEAIEI